MTRAARAFWFNPPGPGEIRAVPLPACGAGEVEVRTLFSGISRGTETLVFRGGVPASQHELMRAPFQEGEFPGRSSTATSTSVSPRTGRRSWWAARCSRSTRTRPGSSCRRAR